MNQIVSYDSQWAEMAERWATDERLTGGTFLSTRGGVLKFGDEELPGNQAAVIVLDSVRENTYYGNKYDPDTAQSPTCYAFGRGGDAEETMGPHPTMQSDLNYFQPQSETCRGCPHNEWGSADQGRGKACQNRRRLALIPAGFYAPKRGSRDFDLEIFSDEKHFRRCEIAYLKLPVTSVKDWAKYVTNVGATVHRPPFGVITRLSLEPDPKSQYRVHFEMIEALPDALAPIIMARSEEAQRLIIQGYKPPEEFAAGRGSLRGIKR